MLVGHDRKTIDISWPAPGDRLAAWTRVRAAVRLFTVATAVVAPPGPDGVRPRAAVLLTDLSPNGL